MEVAVLRGRRLLWHSTIVYIVCSWESTSKEAANDWHACREAHFRSVTGCNDMVRGSKTRCSKGATLPGAKRGEEFRKLYACLTSQRERLHDLYCLIGQKKHNMTDVSHFITGEWSEPELVRYTSRDLLLYAVGIGCGQAGPKPYNDLRHVYEQDSRFCAFPTFPVSLNMRGHTFHQLHRQSIWVRPRRRKGPLPRKKLPHCRSRA